MVCVHDEHGETAELLNVGMLFIAFCLVFLIRMFKAWYLRGRWKNKTIDPTLEEARVEFYSFFTLGLVEVCLQVLAMIYFFDGKFMDLSSGDAEVVTYSLLINVIYGFYDIISYLGKALLLLAAYCYFKVYGGLEVNEEEEEDEE